MKLLVQNCARCGETHEINFEEFSLRPVKSGGDTRTHWGMCSNTNEPVLMKFEETGSEIPEIVCLCGSTRFWKEYQRQNLRLTMEGKIVLSIGAATGTDDEHFGNLPKAEYERIKNMLDELHKRKIDLADRVFIINVGGYIGDSTRSEIEYAQQHGKPIDYLEPLVEG